jgi:hypothetical protein
VVVKGGLMPIDGTKIMIHYIDKRTKRIVKKETLSDFIMNNNYDNLWDDVRKIKTSVVGEIISTEHRHILKRGRDKR